MSIIRPFIWPSRPEVEVEEASTLRSRRLCLLKSHRLLSRLYRLQNPIDSTRLVDFAAETAGTMGLHRTKIMDLKSHVFNIFSHGCNHYFWIGAFMGLDRTVFFFNIPYPALAIHWYFHKSMFWKKSRMKLADSVTSFTESLFILLVRG